MTRSRVSLVAAAMAAGTALAAASLQAALVFTATTKAESPTARLVWLADSTVRGWVDGERGKIEFLRSRNEAWPRGSVLLTTDGGRTVRFFDPTAKTCRPWAPVGGGSPFDPTGAASFRNFRAEKTLDEDGPKLAGFATRHYRFTIAYDASVGSTAAPRLWRTERVEDFWAAKELSEPALAIWLTMSVSRTGSEELDRKLADAMAQVRGALLKRVTVTRVDLDGGRKQTTTTTTLEVTSLAREEVPASTLAEPFPCRIRTPEDRR